MLYDAARKREVRESAERDLRMLNVLCAAIGGAFGKKGQANPATTLARELERLCGVKRENDPAVNRKKILESFAVKPKLI